MNWLNNLLTNADGVTPWWGVVIAVVIMLAIAASIAVIIATVVNTMRKRNERKGGVKAGWTTRQLVFGALCIAIAFALSFFKFFEMPNGGSITPASMLPIMIFAYVYGTPKGLIVGLAYGLLQMVQDLYVVHWAQFILDYILAFMALSLTGLFKRNILPGIITGGIGRFVFAFLSGFIFFGQYAPEGQSAIAYSFVYNIGYMGPEIAICFVVALIPAIQKTIESFKSQASNISKA